MIDPPAQPADCRTWRGNSGWRTTAGRGDWLRHAADPAGSLVEACQQAWATRADDESAARYRDGDRTESLSAVPLRQISACRDAGIAVVDSLPEATLLAAALISPPQKAAPAPRRPAGRRVGD